jgi:SnoaL-like domain
MARGVPIVLPPLSGDASRRRTLDERLAVRFPRVSQRITAAVMRRPPGSRLREQALARGMSRAYAAANRRDFDLIRVQHDQEHEYRPSSDLMPPDLEPVFYGHDGYLRLWRYWLDAFEDIRWDPEEMIDLGEKILVTTHQTGHGSGSGVAVSEPVFQLFTFRRGLVLRQEDFVDRTEALEAAGLERDADNA